MAVSSSPDSLNDSAPEISHGEKSTLPLDEKQNMVVSGKADWNVEINESSVVPSLSRTQRYAHSIRSFFTLATLRRMGGIIWKFAMFTGPGVIISVAFIDPDNYQTAVASGAEFQYKLLFIILFSNAIAVYLQVSPSRKPGVAQGVRDGADRGVGPVSEAGLRDGHGSGTDESCISPTLVKYWSLLDG